MNENINLVEILKDCPRGTKLYSPIYGEVELFQTNDINEAYPINVITDKKVSVSFNEEGKYYDDYHNAECLLFPSKDQRDWSKFKVKKPKFDIKTLKPFDKVLIKPNALATWNVNLFSNIDGKGVMCISGYFIEVIPYNEDTKHLIGTRKDAPDYYKWWED